MELHEDVSTSTLHALLTLCPCLTETQFSSISWDESTVLLTARNQKIVSIVESEDRSGGYNVILSPRLDLSLPPGVLTCAVLIEIFAKCCELREIHIYDVTAFDETVCAQMVNLCPLLSHVSISHLGRTSHCLRVLAKVEHLTSMELTYSNIPDKALNDFLECKPFLIKLTLSDCEGVTAKGLAAIGKYCSRLRYLDLSRCTSVTNVTVGFILTVCPRISSLFLVGCRMITEDLLPYLKSRRMRVIDFSGCGLNETSADLMELKENCAFLHC